MLEKILELKVLNVKPLQHDSMVGSFKVDLGVVYSQTYHCYAQKWLVLVDTRHGGSYTKVKFSVHVLLYGEELPMLAITVEPVHNGHPRADKKWLL